MKRAPISYYLKNPSKLVEISVSQIEKWLQKSPYSQPLRTLLAKKIHFNQELVLDNAITNSAAISGNRTWLYRELHGKVESETNDNITHTEVENADVLNATTAVIATTAIASAALTQETLAPEAPQEAPVDLVESEESIDDTEINTESPEASSEEREAHDLEVDYEEITSLNTGSQGEESIENEEVTPDNTLKESDTPSLEEDTAFDHQDISDDDLNTTDRSLDEIEDEIVIEPLPTIQQKEIKPLIATLDVVKSSPKLIDLNQAESLDTPNPISEIQVVRVDTDEEFIAGRDEKKKKSKGKKKVKKDKTKKKSKKKSGDKEKKDKKKKTSKKDKEKKKGKKEKKERKRLKALSDFWDGNKDAKPTKPEKVKSKKKKSKKKNKTASVDLLKYDIPVNVSEEEANPYKESLDEMSNYTKWLLNFSKDKKDSSFDHMVTSTVKPSNRIEEVSFFESKAKNKKKKNKKDKKHKSIKNVKVKKKSKSDLSLEANEEIISELWADLLAKQGHIKKASKMYLKLSLKYPEKSGYFASKLDNL